MDALEQFGQARKRSGAAIAAGAGAVVSAALGAVMLFVPWKDAALTSYKECHAGARELLGCSAGLSPWLPFVLLGAGAGTLAVMVWARGRR